MAMNLPEELIVKILLRLPVKSLVRFRCVSKSWHSLISDPQFAKSHFELASQHTLRLIYIAASDARSIDYEASLHDDSAVANLKFPLDPPAYFVQIMGSCRGFLLLKNDSNLFLWNPSAGFLRPITPSYSCDISLNVNVVPTLYGFGFDPLTDDFLVVLGSYDPSAAGLVTHFEYLSFKTNSWTKIVGIELPYVNPIDEPGAGVLLNGAIHWLAFRLDEWVGVILAFDLVEKNLREVPMPGEIHFVFCDLGVLEGSLSVSYMGVDSVEIWLMKQYRVRSSWTKSIVLSVTDILTNTFSPICFTKGGEIVGLDGCTGLVKYNQKGELLEQRDYSPDWPDCKVAIYTETLLSLPTSTHRGEARFSVTLCGTLMIEIWIMKEYGVKSSWSKSIILCTDKLLTRYFLPVCFTNNAEIVGIDDHTFLLKCNYSGDLLEHFGDSQNLSGCEAALYAESLLSFPNDHGEI